MMTLQERIELLLELPGYLTPGAASWEQAKQRAFMENNWFITKFTDLAVQNITERFLQRSELEKSARQYGIPEITPSPKRVGIVMAGNIPLVGFHDLLCCFLSGHYAVFKPSSKDQALILQLTGWMKEKNAAA